MEWLNLIGMTVKAFRGRRRKSLYYPFKEIVPIEWILFDDGATFIKVHQQDGYDYHDCNPCARIFSLYKCKKTWKRMMEKGKLPYSKICYEESTEVGDSPF